MKVRRILNWLTTAACTYLVIAFISYDLNWVSAAGEWELSTRVAVLFFTFYVFVIAKIVEDYYRYMKKRSS